MEQMGDSVKYYRDGAGFFYIKSGENQKTLYLDCLRQPNCIAGARFYKESQELVLFGTHSDEKPDEHLLFKIHFEEFLKKDVCKIENSGVSVLKLYKRAKNTVFKGIWLPDNHQTLFLTKLRRLRTYEKKEKPKIVAKKNVVNRIQVQMKAATTSPMPKSMILQRIAYSVDKNSPNTVQIKVIQNLLNESIVTSTEISVQQSSSGAIDSLILPAPNQFQNDTLTEQNLSGQFKCSNENSKDSLQCYAFPSPAISSSTPLQNFAQAPAPHQSSKVDAGISPIMARPSQQKNIATSNQSSILQRIEYSADRSTRNSMERIKSLESSSASTCVKSLNIRVVSNGNATPIATTSTKLNESIVTLTEISAKQSSSEARETPIESPSNSNGQREFSKDNSKGNLQNVPIQSATFLSSIPPKNFAPAPHQSSKVDASISPIMAQPNEQKNVATSNKSLILQRMEYLADSGTRNSMKRIQSSESSNASTCVKSLNIRVVSNGNATPTVTMSTTSGKSVPKTTKKTVKSKKNSIQEVYP